MFAGQLDEQREFRLEQISDQHSAQPGAGYAEIKELLLMGAREALAEIEAARSRLAEGTYGRCVECGVQLPIERLEVLPQVARCLPCHRAAIG
jgi:RNA polymerase-binding transcription factor DksA